jgi:fluoroacetyl-CoA thioesterase
VSFTFGADDVAALVGTVGTARRVVDTSITARSVGSGDLLVLATPMMIALMEAAACDALAGHLRDEVTSVGSRIDVRHSAPSPLGARVTAHATLTAIEGAKVTFDVSAVHDINGVETIVGTGSHVRVVVRRDAFPG